MSYDLNHLIGTGTDPVSHGTEPFDPAEWERLVVNLRAISRHLQSITELWAAATVSLQRAWITDPVVARALKTHLPSNDGRSDNRDGTPDH